MRLVQHLDKRRRRVLETLTMYEDLNLGEWVECWNCCGEGVMDHDCDEDTCCCLYPYDNVPCDICDGNGGWYKDATSRDTEAPETVSATR